MKLGNTSYDICKCKRISVPMLSRLCEARKRNAKDIFRDMRDWENNDWLFSKHRQISSSAYDPAVEEAIKLQLRSDVASTPSGARSGRSRGPGSMVSILDLP